MKYSSLSRAIFSIGIVCKEEHKFGYSNSSQWMFTMNNEGQVESYGKIFENFGTYIEDRARVFNFLYEKDEIDHVDFLSAGGEKLRKKHPTTK